MAVGWGGEQQPGTEDPAPRMVTLDRLSRLRPRDAASIARTLAWFAVARVMIKVRGFVATSSILGLERIEQIDRPPGPLPGLAPATARAMRVAIRLLDWPLMRASCVPRSIAIQRMLSAHRISSELVIGVLLDEGFKAHAWVEVDGHPVAFDEVGAARWKPLTRFRLVRDRHRPAS